MQRRGSGILLHLTSLPSPFGIGDLGPGAYRFADFLVQSKQHFWQILPLNPTDPAYGNSPYHSLSAFASNVLLISPELMVEDGFLSKEDLVAYSCLSQRRVKYPEVIAYKEQLFSKAFEHFLRSGDRAGEAFHSENASWLEDFALFIVLRSRFKGKVWSEWPEELRDRHPEALRAVRKELEQRIAKEKFLQYLFFKQWQALKTYCNQRDIYIFGDMPIYVDHDSADVWAEPEMVKLDHRKRPSFVAGVPPDYFSATGQRWGNPVYQWEVLREKRYSWWMKRIAHNLKLFDMVRIDHFRGLVAYWEIPSYEETAIMGRWVEVPAEDFFNCVVERFPDSPIIAEDLGTITPDVREYMERYGFPGMKVLLFAFGDDLATNPYVPHNHVKNCVVYTGTHDNNTVRGWFEHEATAEDKQRLFKYLGRKITVKNIHWEFIRMALMSVADMAIIPMQDLLGLGGEHRMNLPSTVENNWEWRLLEDELSPSLAERLKEMTEMYGRA